jgi:hypothetical protein
VLELCLVKDPKKRIADISEVRLVLRGKLGASAADPVVIAAQPVWRRVVLLAAAPLSGVVLTGLALWLAL